MSHGNCLLQVALNLEGWLSSIDFGCRLWFIIWWCWEFLLWLVMQDVDCIFQSFWITRFVGGPRIAWWCSLEDRRGILIILCSYWQSTVNQFGPFWKMPKTFLLLSHLCGLRQILQEANLGADWAETKLGSLSYQSSRLTFLKIPRVIIREYLFGFSIICHCKRTVSQDMSSRSILDPPSWKTILRCRDIQHRSDLRWGMVKVFLFGCILCLEEIN